MSEQARLHLFVGVLLLCATRILAMASSPDRAFELIRTALLEPPEAAAALLALLAVIATAAITVVLGSRFAEDPAADHVRIGEWFRMASIAISLLATAAVAIGLDQVVADPASGLNVILVILAGVCVLLSCATSRNKTQFERLDAVEREHERRAADSANGRLARWGITKQQSLTRVILTATGVFIALGALGGIAAWAVAGRPEITASTALVSVEAPALLAATYMLTTIPVWAIRSRGGDRVATLARTVFSAGWLVFLAWVLAPFTVGAAALLEATVLLGPLLIATVILPWLPSPRANPFYAVGHLFWTTLSEIASSTPATATRTAPSISGESARADGGRAQAIALISAGTLIGAVGFVAAKVIRRNR